MAGGNEMKSIFAYIRVSTPKQAEEGVSLEMQKVQIEKYIELTELSNLEDVIYLVDGGLSASSLNRPGMLQLLEAMKNEQVQMIIVYDLSRISREIYDTTLFLKLVEKHGIILKCLHDDVKMKSAGDRMSTNIKMVFNQFEREKVIERTNDSLISIVENGRYPCGGKVPYGYLRGKDKQIYINEEEAFYVKKMIEGMANGNSIHTIINQIFIEKGVSFKQDFVLKVLHNEKYGGTLTYKGKRYFNIVPPIVDDEIRVKAIHNLRVLSDKDFAGYIFDGILVCSKCNHPLTCYCGRGKLGKKYYYYKCIRCNKTISQINLLEQTKNWLLNKWEIDQDLKFIKKRKSYLQTRINNLKKDYVNGCFENQEYLLLRKPLIEEIEKMEVNIKLFSQKQDRNLGSYSLEEQKKLLLRTLAEIKVDLSSSKIISKKLK